MTQISSLDSIINKYRDKLNPSTQSYKNLSSKDQNKVQNIQTITDYKLIRTPQKQQPHRILQQNQPLYFQQRQSSRHASRSKYTQEYEGNSITLVKYKQTLNLYYDQVSKHKKTIFQLRNIGEKLKQAQLKITQLERGRLSDKIEYMQKLQLLNTQLTSNSPSGSYASNDLLIKINHLQEQIKHFRKGEQQYLLKIKLIQDDNFQLLNQLNKYQSYNQRSSSQKPIINFTNRVRTYTFNNPLSQQVSFHRSSPPKISNQQSQFLQNPNPTQFTQLKQTLLKLQNQHNVIVNQNSKLKYQISQLHQNIDDYKYKVTQLEQTLRQGYSDDDLTFNNKPSKRNITQSNRSHTEQSMVQSRSKFKLKDKQKSNQQIQKKLKNLQRDYQKICSQMLTVQSAKKIAKQTSRYYNKK